VATSKPITLQVSDLVQWFRKGELVINEMFQRHSVWTTAAKTFLIDTMLNELPIPKIYIRTKIDPASQTSVREVVDGQQRVRTFVDFADDKLKLTSRSEDFAGKKYSTLDEGSQHNFLAYTITVEQLLNASDDDVIDIFARLNSYTVALNAAELRHAQYQTVFKFAVRKASQAFRSFIEKYNVFSVQKRFRMADDAFMAEVIGVLLDGVKDGGDRYLKNLYERLDDDTFTEETRRLTANKLRKVFSYLDTEIGPMLSGPLHRHYHLLMLIAAYAHHEFGIPRGDLAAIPRRTKTLAPGRVVCDRLAKIERALEADKPPSKFNAFVKASTAQTNRIVSRRVRFNEMVRVLAR
jgi:hypothetical protein